MRRHGGVYSPTGAGAKQESLWSGGGGTATLRVENAMNELKNSSGRYVRTNLCARTYNFSVDTIPTTLDFIHQTTEADTHEIHPYAALDEA